jgi:hypothetical protein
MSLLAYSVGLSQPRANPIVQLIRRFDPEMVNMVAGRSRLDGAKPRVLEAPGEH